MFGKTYKQRWPAEMCAKEGLPSTSFAGMVGEGAGEEELDDGVVALVPLVAFFGTERSRGVDTWEMILGCGGVGRAK